MNTSGLNKSGINQSQNIGSSFKTNQNLERLEKLLAPKQQGKVLQLLRWELKSQEDFVQELWL